MNETQTQTNGATPTQIAKLKRALWLAFQASSPMGMGFMHSGAASQQTEDSLFADMRPRGNEISTDYVFGRMMKTQFKLDENGELQILPETPRLDYQSWGGTYRTAAALIKAVEDSLK